MPPFSVIGSNFSIAQLDTETLFLSVLVEKNLGLLSFCDGKNAKKINSKILLNINFIWGNHYILDMNIKKILYIQPKKRKILYFSVNFLH